MIDQGMDAALRVAKTISFLLVPKLSFETLSEQLYENDNERYHHVNNA
jgi:hypothetical protein